MNEAQVTMIGYVASTPKLFKTKGGRFVANMRVGVTPRLHDKETGQWSDGDTSYMTVTCWRSLATNAAACLRKGDPIVVKGRMRVRQYDDKDGNQRLVVEVDSCGPSARQGMLQRQARRARVTRRTGIPVANGLARRRTRRSLGPGTFPTMTSSQPICSMTLR